MAILETRNMVRQYKTVEEIIGEKTDSSFLVKKLSATCAGIRDFSKGFGYGVYYQMQHNLNHSSGIDYDKKGMSNLSNDQNFGGIGFSTSSIGYGVGKIVAHPLVMAAALAGYYYSKNH